MAEKRDPQTYRKMSEPFESYEVANDAIQAFFDELYELRKKHRIADVHCVVAGNALDRDGVEGPFILNGHIGDSTGKAEMMAAWSLGQAQVSRQEHVARLMSSAGYLKKPK